MKVFIQEYATSGGLPKEKSNAKLLVEGFGILRVILQNCKRLGYEVVTTINKQIRFLTPYLDADKVVSFSPKENLIKKSLELINGCDYFLVIAPETHDILSHIVKNYQKSIGRSLNCQLDGIDITTYKSKAYEFCASKGILFPKTIKINKDGSSKLISLTKLEDFTQEEPPNDYELGYPLIIKPDDGVACEGLSLCKNKEEFNKKLLKMGKSNFLIQEFIKGDNLSVTALVWDRHINILSINEQILSLGFRRSEYLGGISNVKHVDREKIISFCEKLLHLFKGLNGLIGIDLVISGDKDKPKNIYLIEINPRPTTALCGLLNQSNPPIPIIPNSTFSKGENFNTTYFMKVRFDIIRERSVNLHEEFINNQSIVTPPISFNSKEIYSLIRGFGKNKKIARANFDENLNSLLSKLKKE